MHGMKAHPLSDVFPMLDAGELAELAADIEANGLQEPVVTLDGMILDGRNRWAACKSLKMKQVPTREYDGANPLAFVISANIRRRHLTTSQRAMIAAELAKMPHGGDRRSDQAANLPLETQASAAALLNVSDRSVRDAATVLANGKPREVAAVKAGEAAVATTAKEIREREQAKEIRQAAKEDPDRFGDLVAELDDDGKVAAIHKELKKRQGKARAKGDTLKDALGVEVPSGLRDLFGDPWLVQTATALEEIHRDVLRSIRKRVDGKGPRFKFLHVAEVLKALDRARTDLEIAASQLAEARPYAVCPGCAGKGCKLLCRDAGWLPKWRHTELKKERAI
jgi:ParB-like chromosome segregation protein Spo0J